MKNAPDPDDIKALWQSQETETPKMLIEEIRRRAERFQANLRREFIGSCVVALALIAFSIRMFTINDDMLWRAACVLLAGWSLIFPFQARKRIQPEHLPPDAAFKTCLAFYRTQLERQRNFFRTRRAWLWVVGPVLLWGGLLVLPLIPKAMEKSGRLLNMMPFLLLLAVWVIAFFFVQRRKHGELQQEIDLVNALERDSR